jgi:trigger factor
MATKVEVKSGGPCRKVLQVNAGWEDVQADYERALNAFTAQAEMPGFRRGKAPRAMVEHRYRRAIEEETREHLTAKFYQKAIEQEQIRPLAIVNVRDVTLRKGEPFAMTVTVDVPPDFSLPRYRSIPVKASTISVSDADLDDAYRRFLDRFARFEEVASARAVAKGDLALVDYAGACDGKPLEAVSADCRDVASGRDAWVLVDQPEFMPGFTEGLAGMNIGETRTLSVAFPADYHVKSVAGKQTSYTVTVKKLREKRPAEVNEEFLKGVGVDSEAALRDRLREQMLHAAQERDLNQRREQVARFLLSETKMDVPPSVVEQEIQMTVRNMVKRIVAQGGTREQIAENRASIMDTATRTSLDRVKLGYILSKIAEEEKIEVAEDEVDARLAAMAPQFGMDSAQLRAVLEKRNGLDGLRAEMREEKAMAAVLAQAKVQE